MNTPAFFHILFIVIPLLLLFVITSETNAQSTSKPSINTTEPIKCATPNSTEGVCVHLHECQSLQQIRNTVPLTTEILTYLRKAQCDYNELEPKVCCQVSSKFRKFELPVHNVNRTRDLPLPNRFKPDAGLPGLDKCGRQSFDDRIHNGEVTAIDEFPWMALLEYNRMNPYGHGFACGGTLISNRYVLTAAHCVSGKNAEALGGLKSVRLGEYNIDTPIDCDSLYGNDCADPPIDSNIEKTIVHPDYDEDSIDQLHDIALIKLSKNIDFSSDFIKPICLSSKLPESIHEPGHQQFVAGWGQNEFNRNSPIKMKLKLPVVEENTCAEKYRPFGIRLGKRQICAGGEKDKDSCSGDSGGPLMVQAVSPSTGVLWYMTGIVSIGPTPCATNKIPGIYTKVHDYMNWILENIK